MSEKKIRLLQVGQSNWQDELEIPKNIQWIFLQSEEIFPFLKKEKQKIEERYQKERAANPKKKGLRRPKLQFDGVIVTESTYPLDLLLLEQVVEPYRVFFPSDLQTDNVFLQTFLNRRLAQAVDVSDKRKLLATFSKIFFSGQFGQKMGIAEFEPHHLSELDVHYEGNAYLIFDGNFGQHYQSIGTYIYGVPYYKDIQMELWQEFIKDPTCQLKIRISLIVEGSLADVVDEWEVEGDDLQIPTHIDHNCTGNLAITILAKGSGRLKLGPLHYRWSRAGFGDFVFGGQRFSDQNRQEFNYFFHPGDFKPPLCVYFSGWRAAEGFEGYGMMRRMGTPMLLICDPRLTGGSFYFGTEEFEEMIPRVIQKYLDYLGFTNKELILSGLSMGTFGATYYGAELNPHAIIIAKPVFSLGRVAQLEKIERPGIFKTSLDILLSRKGSLSESAARSLDRRFWDKCVDGNFEGTKFFIAYMKEDDYDHTAFFDTVECLGQKGVQIVGRGWTGRHNDGLDETLGWFLKQYSIVLASDFGRGNER